jgi:sulfatase maturation enzyme AslB (radical SAM superfamily)
MTLVQASQLSGSNATAPEAESIAVTSHPDSVHHLVSALEACARHDIYWSNEYFYRWLQDAPTRNAGWLSAFARRPKDLSVEAAGCRFVIRQTRGPSDQLAWLERMASDARFPGAAVAWARRLAKNSRNEDALAVARQAYARIEGSPLPWDFHILRNQITALEWRIAGTGVSRALQRYLGDDDGYMAERTCPYPFENINLQEDGVAGVCCAPWMPGFSLGNAISSKQTATQIYNGDNALAARRSVLDGSFRYCDHYKCRHIACDELPTKADLSGENATKEYRMPGGDLVGGNTKRAVNTGQFVFEAPSLVLLAFDKSCNLSCQSCRTHLITEKIELQLTKETLIEESIVPLLRRAESLNLNAAGEIFVSRPLRRLLSRLNSKDFPNLKIDMITNGTLFNRKEWEKFPGIHDMIRSIRVSTDGATKLTFEKLRRGAFWEPFVENMRFLGELRQSGVFETLKFSFTYQKDNYREMPLFVDWTQSIDPGRHVLFERLDNWGSFDPEVFRDLAVHVVGHPLHEEFLSIIRQPKLKPASPVITADYAVLV